MPSVSIPTALAVAGTAASVASAASGIMSSGAAKSAGKTQAAAATSAAGLQQQMFGQIQTNLNPFMQVGQGAIPMLQGLTGTGPGGPGAATGALAGAPGSPAGGPAGGPGGGPVLGGATDSGPGGPGGGNPMGATPFDPQSFLASTPGYQFTRNQGLMATQNSYAAQGLGQSGAALKGAANYATGLADTTYEARLGDYFKMLEGGQQAATDLGKFGTSAGQNIGNTQMSGAAATAAGTVGSANDLGAGLTGVAKGIGSGITGYAGGGMFNQPADTSGWGFANGVQVTPGLFPSQ
jgi:hypothetical protein